MFVFLEEHLDCNSHNRRLMINLQVFNLLSTECLAFALSHCWSDYQHFCTKKKQNRAGCWRTAQQMHLWECRLAFLAYALKEKSLS